MKTFLKLSFALLTLLMLVGCAGLNWYDRTFHDITTNRYPVVVMSTNIEGIITVQTNYVESYKMQVKEGYTTFIKEGAGSFGPMGQLVGGAIVAALLGYAGLRNKKLGQANKTLSQGQEVSLEVLKQVWPAAEELLKRHIEGQQKSSGTKDIIAKVVDEQVDENAAKNDAAMIVKGANGAAAAQPLPPAASTSAWPPPPAPRH